MAAAASGTRVVVGVTGGIAAYKGLELVRLLAERGFDVQVLPTLAALRFVGEASFAALSGNPVRTDIWADVQNVPHVAIGQAAQVVVVAPATADFLARAAAGNADDLLTATLLTCKCPVIIAPAMHTEMWENPATTRNVAVLRERGWVVLEPAAGRLTGVDAGKGRLPEPSEIAVAVELAANGDRTDLVGRRVVVTAGGTREPIDPVRFIGNRSSGRQGYALAAAAAARGARVTLISANVALPQPAGCDIVEVSTAAELAAAVERAQPGCDALVMAAAVADFRPIAVAAAKLKKQAGLPAIELAANPDILKAAVARRTPGQVIVGFAAETGDDLADGLAHARTKFAEKGCDVLVYNQVGPDRGFETEDNEVVILSAAGELAVPRASKLKIATTVWNVVIGGWSAR